MAKAQAAIDAKAKREAEHVAELKLENEKYHFAKLLTVEPARRAQFEKRRPVAFLYEPPPGLPAEERKKEDGVFTTDEKKIEISSLPSSSSSSSSSTVPADLSLAPVPTLQLDAFSRTKPDAPPPSLDSKTLANPTGPKCMRCQGYGHTSIDPECPLNDRNPVDDARKLREDPMAVISANSTVSPALALKDLASAAGVAIHGGFTKDDPSQQLVGDADDDDMEARFLAQLTDEEKRQVLKRLRKLRRKAQEKKEEKKEESAAKRPKKEHHHHHHHHHKHDSDDE